MQASGQAARMMTLTAKGREAAGSVRFEEIAVRDGANLPASLVGVKLSGGDQTLQDLIHSGAAAKIHEVARRPNLIRGLTQFDRAAGREGLY